MEEASQRRRNVSWACSKKESREGAASYWAHFPNKTPEEQKSDLGEEMATKAAGGSRFIKCTENARLK